MIGPEEVRPEEIGAELIGADVTGLEATCGALGRDGAVARATGAACVKAPVRSSTGAGGWVRMQAATAKSVSAMTPRVAIRFARVLVATRWSARLSAPCVMAGTLPEAESRGQPGSRRQAVFGFWVPLLTSGTKRTGNSVSVV